MPAWRSGPLRRRPQARFLPDRRPGAARAVRPRVPRGGGRHGHAARDLAAGARGRRDRAHGHHPNRDRSHRRDGGLVQEPPVRARSRGSLRLHPQEGLPELRDGAREGLRRIGHARAERTWDLRRGAAAAIPQPSRRRGGAALGSAAPRELHRAGVRVSASAAVLRRPVDSRRSGSVPHRAQDVAALTLDHPLPRARTARRGRCHHAAGDTSRGVRVAVHEGDGV